MSAWMYFIIAGYFNIVASFNLDVEHAVVNYGNPDSYFGFSMSVHQYANQSWILVGAPQQKNKFRQNTGSVHKCMKKTDPKQDHFQCSDLFPLNEAVGDDPWLGATITSTNGEVLVCAPRAGEEANGQCYLGKDSLSSFNPTPLFPEEFCEMGFSAVFTRNPRNIFTGGPSCLLNQGRVIRSSSDWIQAKNLDIAYVGYTLASGNILNGKEGILASVGFHRNSNFAGKVYLLETNNLLVMGHLEGYQSGEHFGASLSVSDVNGDSLDDIIIGAPLYTDYNDPQVKFEIGAVYVYYQTDLGTFLRSNELVLRGQTSAGRFGHAVASLGDTNGDGYNDVAVGAPYQGSGVVYIFHGSRAGLRRLPAQIIYGNSFQPELSTFGYSFSGAADLDGNQYADVVVGAYKSGAFVYLPARPVIQMADDISFKPQYIDLDKKSCPWSPAGSHKTILVACVLLEYCFSYDGRSVPDSIDIEIVISLDVRQPKSRRHFFLETDDSQLSDTVTLIKRTNLCLNKMTYVRPDIRDKLTSMEAEMTVRLPTNYHNPGLPVLDAYRRHNSSTTLTIYKDCGQDSVCNPDLRLSAKTNINQVVQGSSDRLDVDVSIYNDGEDAFESQFYLHLPKMLDFINTDRSSSSSSVLCSPPNYEDDEHRVLICDIGNPLSTQQSVSFRVYLQPSPDVNQPLQSISFTMDTNSTNSEIDGKDADNHKTIDLPLVVQTGLSLRGWTRPDTITVNTTALNAEMELKNGTTGPTFVQFFEVRNQGPSDILGATLQIGLPLYTDDGAEIIQMLKQLTVTEGEADCQSIPLGNYESTLPFRYNGEAAVAINCTTGRIGSNDRVVIRLSARLSAEAIINIKANSFTIVSTILGKVTSLPFRSNPSVIPLATAKIPLNVEKISGDVNLLQATPWWIPVSSAVGATLLLIITSFILHKCGFFKRDRPGQPPLNKETDPSSNDYTLNEPNSDISDGSYSEEESTA